LPFSRRIKHLDPDAFRRSHRPGPCLRCVSIFLRHTAASFRQHFLAAADLFPLSHKVTPTNRNSSMPLQRNEPGTAEYGCRFRKDVSSKSNRYVELKAKAILQSWRSCIQRLKHDLHTKDQNSRNVLEVTRFSVTQCWLKFRNPCGSFLQDILQYRFWSADFESLQDFSKWLIRASCLDLIYGYSSSTDLPVSAGTPLELVFTAIL
jgi:hypothetical protein